MALAETELMLVPVMEGDKIKKVVNSCGGWNLLFMDSLDNGKMHYIPVEEALKCSEIHGIIPSEFLDIPEEISEADDPSSSVEVLSGECSKPEKKEKFWSRKKVLFLLEARISQEAEFTKATVGGKGKIWGRIAEAASQEFGVPVLPKKCEEKFRNLWKTYRDNKDRASKTGEANIAWEFFNIFDTVYGAKENVSPIADNLGTTPKPPSYKKTGPSKKIPTLTPRQSYLLNATTPSLSSMTSSRTSPPVTKPAPPTITSPTHPAFASTPNKTSPTCRSSGSQPVASWSIPEKRSRTSSESTSTPPNLYPLTPSQTSTSIAGATTALFSSYRRPSTSSSTHSTTSTQSSASFLDEEDADAPDTPPPTDQGNEDEEVLDRIYLSDKGPTKLQKKTAKKPLSKQNLLEKYVASREEEKALKAAEKEEKRRYREQLLLVEQKRNELLAEYIALKKKDMKDPQDLA